YVLVESIRKMFWFETEDFDSGPQHSFRRFDQGGLASDHNLGVLDFLTRLRGVPSIGIKDRTLPTSCVRGACRNHEHTRGPAESTEIADVGQMRDQERVHMSTVERCGELLVS